MLDFIGTLYWDSPLVAKEMRFFFLTKAQTERVSKSRTAGGDNVNQRSRSYYADNYVCVQKLD